MRMRLPRVTHNQLLRYAGFFTYLCVGIPLMRDGKVIGGIGCSGGTGQQDGVACKAGADTIK